MFTIYKYVYEYIMFFLIQRLPLTQACAARIVLRRGVQTRHS